MRPSSIPRPPTPRDRRTPTGSLFIYERLDTGAVSLGAADNVRVLNVAQVLPDRTTPVSVVRVATVGAERVVIAAGGGLVTVFDIAASRVVATHSRHKGAEVTCVAVDAASGRIVSGDDRGAVVVADSGLVPVAAAGGAAGGLASGFRSLFKSATTATGAAGGPVRDMPSAIAGGLDPPAPIVELQLAPAAPPLVDELVCAVSTTTRACLLRIPAAARGAALAPPARGAGPALLECVPVGRKPRDGDFGAAFELTSCAAAGSQRRLAFAARPAKRIWVVDVDAASVLSTVK